MVAEQHKRYHYSGHFYVVVHLLCKITSNNAYNIVLILYLKLHKEMYQTLVLRIHFLAERM